MIPARRPASKDPLIHTVAEFIFSSALAGVEAIPGYLYSFLPEGHKAIQPVEIENFSHWAETVPFTSVLWNEFSVNFSKQGISVSCDQEVLHWSEFKTLVHHIFSAFQSLSMNPDLARYSIKMVRFLPYEKKEGKADTSALNISLAIANGSLEKENFHLRTELTVAEFTHILQIASLANVVIGDVSKQGIIIDVDTVKPLFGVALNYIIQTLDDRLNTLLNENRQLFLKCVNKTATE
jgi:uncharacterized protein (TIGR04255 family)